MWRFKVQFAVLDAPGSHLSPFHPLLEVGHQSSHIFIRLSVSTFQFLQATAEVLFNAVYTHTNLPSQQRNLVSLTGLPLSSAFSFFSCSMACSRPR